MAGEILAAKLFNFLDDADINERRARAVTSRRGLSREDAQTIGALDESAIARVRDECRPDARNADELHDVLMSCAYLTAEEIQPFKKLLDELMKTGRATVPPASRRPDSPLYYIATERLPWFEAIQVDTSRPEAGGTTRESALTEIIRGRLELLGPTTASHLADELGLLTPHSPLPTPNSLLNQALLTLESQGVILRGQFTPGVTELEWCDRRLLARIHRYTLTRLRHEIQPVSAGDYMRFLFSWQHAEESAQLDGPRGVSEAIAQLQGFEIAAAAWERDVLASRVRGYDKRWLDQLSLSGDISWGRRFPAKRNTEGKRHSGQIRNTSIGLFLRDQLDFWLALAPVPPASGRQQAGDTPAVLDESYLSSAARAVLEQLRKRGAVFFQNLTRETRRLPVEIENALGELVAFGLVTGDGFGGLRALLTSASQRRRLRRRERFLRERHAQSHLSLVPRNRMGNGLESAGRWSLFRGDGQPSLFGEITSDEATETVARQLLRRWGVVFHRVLAREKGLPPWISLLKIYRRLEARGEIRGGRFVVGAAGAGGFSGEQYALPEAVERLRAVRDRPHDDRLLSISAADPLNQIGILIPGEKIAARAATRILFRNGLPVAVKEAGQLKILQQDATLEQKSAIQAALFKHA
jgi:ATP-dependent Lhr-like helicase